MPERKPTRKRARPRSPARPAKSPAPPSPQPHAPAPRRERGDVRERILDAAMAILHEEGIQGLSQVQVSRRAKVRQSHLTYYFPKRHDLTEAVAQRFLDGMLHDIEQATAGAAAGGVEAMLRRMAAAILDRGHMRMFTAVVVEADGDPELRAMLARLTRRLQAMLAERLGGGKGGIRAMERAERVLAAMWGMGLYDFIMRPARPPVFPTEGWDVDGA